MLHRNAAGCDQLSGVLAGDRDAGGSIVDPIDTPADRECGEGSNRLTDEDEAVSEFNRQDLFW